MVRDGKKTSRNQTNIDRGARLKRLRQLVGLTILELANKAGVSRATLTYWENASPVGLTARGAHKVINALKKENIDCHFEWLWENVGKEPRYLNPSERTDNPLFSMQNEINFFLETHRDAVVVKVDTRKLFPSFEYEDIVGGRWEPLDTLRSDGFCIVSLNGVNQVKWVKRTDPANNKVLITFSPSAEGGEEVTLEEVAPVVRVWR